MGRDKREHQRKVQQRNEQRSQAIQSGVAKANAVLESWEKIYDTISRGKMPVKQTDALRRNFVATVPIEMAKAIKVFIVAGKEVTVASLLEETRNTPGFLPTCSRLGLGYPWFEEQARIAIEEYEQKHGKINPDKTDMVAPAGNRDDDGGNAAGKPASLFGKISQLFRHRE